MTSKGVFRTRVRGAEEFCITAVVSEMYNNPGVRGYFLIQQLHRRAVL
jgi:hypothetical protein